MDLRVSGMVWLPKQQTDPDLIKYFRKELTITPRMAPGYDDTKPEPVRCYKETALEFGVPRSYWFKTVTRDHNYDWDVSTGSEWEDCPDSILTHEGPYVEQGTIIDLFVDRFERAEEGDEISSKRAGMLMGGILQADTGFGKTDTALGIIHAIRHTTLIIVHKEFLQRQWVERAQKWFPGIRIGIVREKKCDFEEKHIVIAMVESLALDDGNRYPEELYSWPKVVVSDECFIGSQKVATYRGGVPISEIKVGNVVQNINGGGVVTKVHKREVLLSHMRVVKWDGGEAVCTDSHPFLTQRGWVMAAELTPTDYLLTSYGCIDTMLRHGHKVDSEYMRLVRERKIGSEGSSLLLKRMHRNGEEGGDASLRGVSREHGEAFSESFLFPILSAEVDATFQKHGRAKKENVFFDDRAAQEESRACKKSIRENEEEQSNEVGRREVQGVSGAQGDRTQTTSERGERDGAYKATRDSLGCVEPRRVDSGVCGCDGEGTSEWVARTLQNRPCESGEDGCNRGGRPISRLIGETESRQKKGCFPAFKRVVSVSRAKRDDIERHQGISGVRQTNQGDVVSVYNLSVDGHPSYALADTLPYRGNHGVVVHNCHRIGAPSWSPVIPRFTSAFRIGLTATPRRRDGADKVFWWHIGDIVYRAKTETPKPTVRMLKVKQDSLPPVVRRDNVKAPIIINIITKLKKRNRVVVNDVMKALDSPSQRKVFVLSERLEHLRQLEISVRAAWNEKHPDEELTTGFYVGEWFTGEIRPKLAKRTWPMKDGGRERAIETIYRSLSRRWKPIHELSDIKPMISVDKETMEKSHHVLMKKGDYAVIAGVIFSEEEEEMWVDVVLEKLEDHQLYELAKQWKIAQEKKEKMRRRTVAELFEAERARVVFATFQMCSEGVDIPALDTEVLATPISDVQQANGRIRRYCFPKKEKCEHFCPWRAERCQGKPEPMVADIVDLGIPLSTKRERWRREYYESVDLKVVG